MQKASSIIYQKRLVSHGFPIPNLIITSASQATRWFVAAASDECPWDAPSGATACTCRHSQVANNHSHTVGIHPCNQLDRALDQPVDMPSDVSMTVYPSVHKPSPIQAQFGGDLPSNMGGL